MMKRFTKFFSMALTLCCLCVFCFPVESLAASNRVYCDQVLVSGNTAYCAGAEGLYQVKLKEGKVKSKKLLTKWDTVWDDTYIGGMTKKNGYVYYQKWDNGTHFYVSRVKISSKKDQTLAKANDKGIISYMIKGKKIYYKPDDSKAKVMKLNGKGKKKTSVNPTMNIVKTNKDGYSIKVKKKGDKITTYLKTPKGKFKLGSHNI